MYQHGRQRRALVGAVSLLATLALGACSSRSSPEAVRDGAVVQASGSRAVAPDPPAPPADGPAAGGKTGTASQVSLSVADRAAYHQVLERHKGKVVLVDFWATWCGPCLQQFPHTVQLSREHRDRGLAVVSVSMDDPADEAKVRKFLQEQGADFDNLLGKYGVGSEFVEAFEIRGEVPFYKLYDRAGQLRYQFSSDPSGLEGGEAISQLDRRVKELLAE